MSSKSSILDFDPIPWGTPAILVVWPPEFPTLHVQGTIEECLREAVRLASLDPCPTAIDIYTDDYELLSGTDLVTLAELLLQAPQAIEEPIECTSPPCLMNEVDPAYFGLDEEALRARHS